TNRLILVAGTVESTVAAAKKKYEVLSKLLNAIVPKEFPPPLMESAMEFLANAVEKNPEKSVWWNWFCILKSAESRNTLIGCMGFKGKPNAYGAVEVGYSILNEFQNRGYATEGVNALIEWALQNGATSVAAETYPENKASIRIMEKCGMSLAGVGSKPNTVRFSK
ncbi:MAG: hypothetical protein A4S09_17015, partial [Proteobacteria bacterium SG_bin7]